jgi:hypothetical protein
MIRFAVYGSIVNTSRASFYVPSFAPGPGRVPLGTIVAPEGTALHRSDSPMPKVKVPRAHRPGEYWLYNARDAIRAARRVESGLAWERAATNASRAV